jgi:7-carboxy-7-deazaguanine synthase
MRISEVYVSCQGEGLLTGTDSVFVRTSGCNLRCDFCDTPFTSWEPEGDTRSLDELVAQILAFDVSHVVITGGEPMLSPAIVELTERLSEAGRKLTIETAGTIDRPVRCDLMSISPKLSNSTPPRERAGAWTQRHESRRIQIDVLKQLVGRYPYQLKFVVAHANDLNEIFQLLGSISNVDRQRVLLMPEGTDLATLQDRSVWLEPLATDQGFRFCPRKHIEWYGHTRGT